MAKTVAQGRKRMDVEQACINWSNKQEYPISSYEAFKAGAAYGKRYAKVSLRQENHGKTESSKS